MTVRLNLQSIKKIISNQYFILGLIIVLAYILRVLPYLLGYPLPFTEDGINDFNEVKKFSQLSEIIPSSDGYYTKHTAFPVLRLIVLGVSKIGFDQLKTFLFLPQVFACLGILFYFLFLKKYLSVKISLLACFLIAVFGPHIHWSAQPVIETMGLFFFPVVIYLFDREVSENKRNNILNKIFLLAAMALMVASHHWSTLMIIGWLVFYVMIFIKEKRTRAYALFWIGLFVILALVYWHFLFPEVFDLILAPLSLPLLLVVVGLLLVFLLKPIRGINFLIQKIRNKKWPLFIVIPVLLVFVMAIVAVLPMVYPIQIWAMFFLFVVFMTVGFFSNQDDNIDKISLISFFFILVWLIVIPFIFAGYKIISMPIDPFRTFEFIIFPLSVYGALGIIIVCKKNYCFLAAIAVVMVFLATLIYPSVFIYKNNFYGTPFYDIRSDIRHLSSATIELIDWAKSNDYYLDLFTPEARAYQNLISNNSKKQAILTSKNDKSIMDNYYLIHDPIMRVDSVRKWDQNIEKDYSIVYQNKDGKILASKYGAEFIEQKIPKHLIFKVGQKINFSFVMKNTGSKVWFPEDGYFLQDKYFKATMKLDRIVNPGEAVTFVAKDFIVPDNIPNHFKSSLQLYKDGLGLFGESTPNLDISIIK